jgi:hypothetical protein
LRVHLDDPAVLAGEGAAWLVVGLLQATGNGRHVLALAEPLVGRARELLEAQTKGAFRQQLEEALERALAERDALDRTVAPGARPAFPHAEIAFTDHPSEHCKFRVPPERALDWLREPLFLLTENDIDGGLVVAAARGLGRANLLAAIGSDREWIRVNGRGGTGEIPPRLHSSRPLERLFVLVDSDRDIWDGPISKKAKEIEELCKNAKIPCHVLRRREAENHIPLSSLHDSATRHGRVSAQLKRGARGLERLSDEQRWIIPLDTFFAEQRAGGSTSHHWSADRCKKWLRELLCDLRDGRAKFEDDALEHLTNLLDELERWL